MYDEFQISSLLGSLIQLVKTGFTKAVQRLDGIYALQLVAKLAANDIKAGSYSHACHPLLQHHHLPFVHSGLIVCLLPFHRRDGGKGKDVEFDSSE